MIGAAIRYAFMLEGLKKTREALRKRGIPLVEVSTNVIVPVEAASPKEEYAATTLRPKLYRLLDGFLTPLHETPLRVKPIEPALESWDIGDTDSALARP
jgi:deoxyribodipyrimidine photo-lyase